MSGSICPRRRSNLRKIFQESRIARNALIFCEVMKSSTLRNSCTSAAITSQYTSFFQRTKLYISSIISIHFIISLLRPVTNTRNKYVSASCKAVRRSLLLYTENTFAAFSSSKFHKYAMPNSLNAYGVLSTGITILVSNLGLFHNLSPYI